MTADTSTTGAQKLKDETFKLLCSHLDCNVMDGEAPPNEFFVDKIIGQQPSLGKIGEFLWLVKWDGYVGRIVCSSLSFYPCMLTLE